MQRYNLEEKKKKAACLETEKLSKDWRLPTEPSQRKGQNELLMPQNT